jgi:hypothetical protein
MENLSQFETCYKACLERNDPTPNDLVVRSRSWMSGISEKELKCFIKTILKPECKDDESNNQNRLRHVQLQILLRLQLLLVKEEVFLQRYIKICKRRHKKSQTTPTKTPQDVLLDDMIRILSTAAFLLDQNRPFAQFLTTTILTSRLSTCLPHVVSALLDAFEIPNPHLPKSSKDDDMELEPEPVVVKVKRKKRKLQQPQAPPKRQPLITSKKNRFQQSHFHANHKLEAISKLLDATPRPTTTTTRMNHNRTKLAKITPQSMPSKQQQSTTLGRPNRLLASSNQKSLLQPPSRPKSSLLKKQPQQPQQLHPRRTVVQETPAVKSRPRQVQETPMCHSPMPFNNRSSVQETRNHLPLSHLNNNTHPRSVQETPGLHNRGRRLAPETPAGPMLDLDTTTTTSESPAVRPMNLFG